MAKDSLAKASTPEPFSTSRTSNWVARGGGLPDYIQHVAHDLMDKRGKTESEAIEIAIGVIKNWAAGKDDVDANTRAAAQKALAEWEKLKAANRAKGIAKKVSEAVLETFDPRRHPRDRMGRWRELVGQIQALAVGGHVRASSQFHVHKIAATGDRKYRVTMKSPNPAHPDRRVYVQTAAEAADAALGVSPAEADSQARNIRAGRSASERRRISETVMAAVLEASYGDAEDAKDKGADESSEDQPTVFCPKCRKKVKPTNAGKCPTCGTDLSKAMEMAKKVQEAVLEAVLSAKDRKQLPKKAFAIPPDRYPIHDLAHARNALARVAQHGSPDEQAKVRAAVYKRYPQLKPKKDGKA